MSMKKILSLFVLTLMTAVFASCSLNTVFKKGQNDTNLTGTLVEQTSGDQYAGSHLLIGDGGNVVTPLRSLSINLSSEKYLDNNVQVIGKTNTEDDVFEVEGISVLEIVTKDNAKREFIEYKNTDLGFKLRYYSDWKLAEVGNIVTFTAPSESTNADIDKIVLTQSPFDYEPPVASEPPEIPEEIALDESDASPEALPETVSKPLTEDVNRDALKAYAAENLPEEQNIDILFRKVGIDKVNALKVDGAGNNVDYFLYRNGFVYKVSFVAATVAPVEENKNIFNEMLAEFQFTGFTVENSDVPDGNNVLNNVDDPGNMDNANSDGNTDIATDSTTATSTDTMPDTPVTISSSSDDMDSFDSLLYHFSTKYPKNWYYAGVKGTSPGVLHHYGFGDKPLEEGSELIGLDIMAENKADGQSASGDVFSIYVTVDGRTYKISGDVKYSDAITTMAKSIVSVKVETP